MIFMKKPFSLLQNKLDWRQAHKELVRGNKALLLPELNFAERVLRHKLEEVSHAQMRLKVGKFATNSDLLAREQYKQLAAEINAELIKINDAKQHKSLRK